MIFRSRRQRQAAELDAEELESTEVDADTDPDTEVDTDTGTAAADDEGTTEDELAALDEQDWREDGPWDITEVDDVTDDSEGPRIDLGSIVITGYEGMELRLQIDEESQQIISALLVGPDSALEVGAFAAPRSGGMWPELREEIMSGATEAGGSAAAGPGPFGVEVRRMVPVATPEGEEGYQPTRMWLVEGPRWMLRGVLYGAAALEDGEEGPVAPLLTAFRQIVVRRGGEAMAPGDLLPLSIPKELTGDGGSLEDDAEH